jgi:hypothetical protein
MGLLDAVLGAVTNHAQNNPQILEAAASLLGNDGGTGGLEGLVDKLTPAGQSPAGGLGNADDLMGALGNLFNR